MLLQGVVVVIVVLILIISAANFFFNQQVEQEVAAMFSANYQEESEIIAEDDINDLPKVVQKWLTRAGVVGQEKISAVRLKQEGKMKSTPQGNWMATRAEQYFTVDEPEFIWQVKVKMAPLLHLLGRDKYKAGSGNMLIKLLGLITVVDESGKEIDQGTLLRYLGEMVWFPTAALSDYMQWAEIDSTTAKATMSYGGITAEAVFEFNHQGDVINFSCQRYYKALGEPSRLEKYNIPLWNHKEFGGVRIPTEGEAIWELDEGDYCYYKLKVTDIDYNQAQIY